MAQQQTVKSEAPRIITTEEEIDCVGKDFTAKYYDALLGMKGAVPLNRFFERTHSALPERIETLVKRLKTERYAVEVDSVRTMRTGQKRFSVVTSGRMSQAGRTGTHEFVHSTVMTVSHLLPTSVSRRRHYSITRTDFRFGDRKIDDDFFCTVKDPKKPVQPTAAPNRWGFVVVDKSIAELTKEMNKKNPAPNETSKNSIKEKPKAKRPAAPNQIKAKDSKQYKQLKHLNRFSVLCDAKSFSDDQPKKQNRLKKANQ